MPASTKLVYLSLPNGLKIRFASIRSFAKLSLNYIWSLKEQFEFNTKRLLIAGMPNGPFIYAKDFINVLKKKHASGTYKQMV